MENEKEVVTYDYKTVRVKREMETMTTDAYINLGWEFVGSTLAGGAIFHINLSFKRNRKIANKQRLILLQEKIDTVLQNIETLLNNKKRAGTVPSISTGIVGALTLGGGMSMVLVGGKTLGLMIGGIAVGIVGIAISLLAWPIYKKVKRAQLSKIEPILESEYNKLADLCEQAR